MSQNENSDQAAGQTEASESVTTTPDQAQVNQEPLAAVMGAQAAEDSSPEAMQALLAEEQLVHPAAPVTLDETQDGLLFQSFSQPLVVPPMRIPHLGHLCLLSALVGMGSFISVLFLWAASYFHFFGVKTMMQSASEVHLMLGTEAIIYLVAFACSLPIFPLFWQKSLFAGIQWQGATAIRLRSVLGMIVLGCFGLAMLDEWLLPGPANAPIEDLFRSPGAAWIMFAFGVTLAPFFEEFVFRGFLLPSLATACDWTAERFMQKAPLPLDANGHPNWSVPAMVIASILTSLPFALIHVEQQGHSIGPFVLLVTVSLILCAVRLKTRSLAASTMVHACYNFLLFTIMLIGTGGFRHFDKM